MEWAADPTWDIDIISFISESPVFPHRENNWISGIFLLRQVLLVFPYSESYISAVTFLESGQPGSILLFHFLPFLFLRKSDNIHRRHWFVKVSRFRLCYFFQDPASRGSTFLLFTFLTVLHFRFSKVTSLLYERLFSTSGEKDPAGFANSGEAGQLARPGSEP